jgi:hypothetical protein
MIVLLLFLPLHYKAIFQQLSESVVENVTARKNLMKRKEEKHDAETDLRKLEDDGPIVKGIFDSSGHLAHDSRRNRTSFMLKRHSSIF